MIKIILDFKYLHFQITQENTTRRRFKCVGGVKLQLGHNDRKTLLENICNAQREMITSLPEGRISSSDWFVIVAMVVNENIFSRSWPLKQFLINNHYKTI